MAAQMRLPNGLSFHERVGRVNQAWVSEDLAPRRLPTIRLGLRKLPSALFEDLVVRPVHFGIRPIRRCDLCDGLEDQLSHAVAGIGR